MKRIFFSFILIFISYVCSRQGYQMVTTLMEPAEKKTVVIDPGHGGEDPGKVGINQVLEKDINLQISLYLKKYLEANDVHVIMTRETDESLSTSTSNRKTSDMSNRKEIIFQNNPAVAISIHQNSYPSETVHGAQVFYSPNNPQSKILAQTIQRTIASLAEPDNTRAIKKSDSSIYLLHKAQRPAVLVECGFLSNPENALKLDTTEFQQKIAFAISRAVYHYIYFPEETHVTEE